MSQAQPLHQLEHNWTLWEIRHGNEKTYQAATRPITDFGSIEKFWECWLSMPKPSEVFGDGSKKVLVDGKEIKALGIFKKGIQPQWEDAQNEHGCQLDALKPLNSEAIDVNWENLVFGLVGETFDEDDNICGARLVFSQKKGKMGYKLEIWLRRKDEDAAGRIRTKLGEILGEGNEKLKTNSRFTSEDFALEKRKKY